MSLSKPSLEQLIDMAECPEHRQKDQPDGRVISKTVQFGVDYVIIRLHFERPNDYVISGASWFTFGSILSKGMCEYICQKIIGQTTAQVLCDELHELDPWMHRICTAHVKKALKDACLEAEETTRA